MQGNASTMRFSDSQGVTHHLPCSKGGQEGHDLDTIHSAVPVHPSIGRVCERQLGCKVVGICDDTFIIARLSKALPCAAEMKKILKADLGMDLNVPKSSVFFPGTSFSLDTARSALELAVSFFRFIRMYMYTYIHVWYSFNLSRSRGNSATMYLSSILYACMYIHI